MKHLLALTSALLILLSPFLFFDLDTKNGIRDPEPVNAVAVSYPVRLAYVDRINQWWPP